MASDLLSDLVSKPQREIAGSDTASRFDYQKNWAFCEMIRRHMAGADYLAAFEFHDDVVFLTPSEVPDCAEFYQVKTTKSATPRKLAAFIDRGSKPNSILGKIFANFVGICSPHQVKVILVSNVAFEFAGENVCAKDLEPKFREKIIEKLSVELSGFSEAQIDDLHFMITGVSIESMHSFLHGETMELFKGKFGEDHGLNVHSWIRLVQSEIGRKNNFPSDQIKNVADLISKKCIGRNLVEHSLKVISGKRRALPDMAIVNVVLKEAGWSSVELIRLSKKIPIAAADYTDATNVEAAKIVELLEKMFDDNNQAAELAAYIEQAKQELLPDLEGPYNDRIYLAAMSIIAYHEKI